MQTEKGEHNLECKNLQHGQHLCYIVAQGFHLQDEAAFKALIDSPQFKCRHCGRVAKSQDNLCEPIEL